MCDIFTENSNVEEMSTDPMSESEDTSTAANHSFPATCNTSRNSEKRRKTKNGKSQALSQMLVLEGRKVEQLEKAVQQKSIMSTQEDEDYHFFTSLLPHLRDIPKRRKLAVRLALQQVLIEEGSGESDRTGVLVHRIIPIILFQLHRHHTECSLQKVNTHSTLLIAQTNHHKDIKNHHLHSCSLLNSCSLESKYVHNS